MTISTVPPEPTPAPGTSVITIIDHVAAVGAGVFLVVFGAVRGDTAMLATGAAVLGVKSLLGVASAATKSA